MTDTPNWITGAEDMLDDIRRIDEESEGLVTAVKAATIRRLSERHGMEPKTIADYMCLDEADVNAVIEGQLFPVGRN